MILRRKTFDKDSKDLSIPSVILILDYFHWGDYYEHSNKNHRFIYDGSSTLEEMIGEGGEIMWNPKKYIKEIFGYFKKDQRRAIHLLIRYGLSYHVLESKRGMKFRDVVPLQVKGLTLIFEDEEGESDHISFLGLGTSIEKLELEGLPPTSVIDIVSRIPYLRHLRLKRIESIHVDESFCKHLRKHALKSARFSGSLEFESDSVIDSFFKNTRVRLLEMSSFPTTRSKFQNNYLQAVSLEQDLKCENVLNALFTLLQGLQNLTGNTNEEDVLPNFREQNIRREEIDISFYKDNFPNLRVVKFVDVDVNETTKFLDRNTICQKIFVECPRDFSSKKGSLRLFKNNTVRCFGTTFNTTKTDPDFLKHLLRGLKKLELLSIVCTISRKGGPMQMMKLLLSGNLDSFASVDLNDYDSIFTQEFCDQIRQLELILPRDKIPEKIIGRFKKLEKMCLTCTNYSSILSIVLKNNPNLRELTTINLLKVKHAASISDYGKSIRHIHFYEAKPQAIEILKVNSNIHSFQQDSRSFPKPKTWRRKGILGSVIDDGTSFKPFPPFICPPRSIEKILSTDYLLLLQDTIKNGGRKEYFETTKFSYKDTDEDGPNDDTMIDENDGKTLLESSTNISMVKEVTKFLTEKFSKVKGSPTNEEKIIYEKIAKQSCGRNFYNNDWGRTTTKKSRIYSLIQESSNSNTYEYFDFEYVDHHRARSTYHEAFSFFKCKYSKDGVEREFFNTDYDMSNFEKKEFSGGTSLLKEVKLRLFGDELFQHVLDEDPLLFLEFLMIVCSVSRYNLKWIRKAEKGDYKVSTNPMEDEGSDSDDDDDRDSMFGWSEPKSKVGCLYGDKGAVFNIIVYSSEVYDDEFSSLK